MTPANGSRKRRQTVLIVDDATFNIEILAEALAPEFKTRFAMTGERAIALARSDSPPDLILLDIMMPGIDGFETCEILKSDERSANIPVIFVTAKMNDEDQRKGLEIGAVDYITKPVSPAIVKSRVRTHLELEKHRRRLEAMVAERAKEVEELQARLYQARKLEAIGTMAGGIAHDFNNIVGSILLNAELALDDAPAGSDAGYCLEQIVRVSKRAKKLVQRILTFSGKTEDIRHPVDIAHIVRESLEMLRPMIPPGVELEEKIAFEPCWAMASGTQIHRLTANLSENALHAMKNRRGKIRVTLERVKDAAEQANGARESEGTIVLTVSDEGPGIAPECRDRIFDPFFTTRPPGEGSGLGLSVVHGIVSSHEGKILVESEPSGGSTFRVLFPEIERGPEKWEVAEENDNFRAGRARILLVDDEKHFLDANRRVLERLGHEVTTEADSLKAFHIFKKRPDLFDLTILDMRIPGMNGLELAEKIHGVRPKTPVIICTGFAGDFDAGKAGARVAGLVKKPFDREEIAVCIRRALESSRRGTPVG